MVASVAAQTGDAHWDDFFKHPPGYWSLKGVSHNPQPQPNNEYRTNTFKSENGKIEGTSKDPGHRIGNQQPGSASATLTWTPLPKRIEDNQKFDINISVEGKKEGEILIIDRNTIRGDGSVAGACQSFQDASPLSIPPFRWNGMPGEKVTKTIKFPSFAKIYSCYTIIDRTSDSADAMRKASLVAGKYEFNYTLQTELDEGQDNYTYTYVWVPTGKGGATALGKETGGSDVSASGKETADKSDGNKVCGLIPLLTLVTAGLTALVGKTIMP
ncbi:MAG: hypothetical protein V1875_05015 [Candidatus Altiarchaeota archaeon]